IGQQACPLFEKVAILAPLFWGRPIERAGDNMTRTIEKKNIDWSKLGFDYTKTDYRFSAIWEDGEWNDGELLTSEFIQLREGSPALHYSQQCFEGLKAQTAEDGRVLLFRPELNAERMANTAVRL